MSAEANDGAEESLDRFLGGALQIYQPRHGFRAGMDSVLLAAALELEAGALAVELGTGAGAALLCAAFRLREGRFIGLERDHEALARARRNILANEQQNQIEAVWGDATAPELPGRGAADCVFFNPPFAESGAAMRAPKTLKRASLIADAPIAAWIAGARAILKPRGRVLIIYPAAGLSSLLAAFGREWGAITLAPIAPRLSEPAKRIIVRAERASRAPLTLLAPLVLHDDDGGHSAEADAIWRGAPFDWSRRGLRR